MPSRRWCLEMLHHLPCLSSVKLSSMPILFIRHFVLNVRREQFGMRLLEGPKLHRLDLAAVLESFGPLLINADHQLVGLVEIDQSLAQ